jgi:hypothetical protein
LYPPAKILRLLGAGVVPLVAGALASPAWAGAQATPLLPDLVQEVPAKLTVQKTQPPTRRARWQLGFRSSAVNVGAGPLVTHGHRSSTAERRLIADQLVSMSDGTVEVRARVGRLQYIVNTDHSHWHFLKFERYTLRKPGGKIVRQDRKSATGFCLGDRYLVGEEPKQLPHPPFDGDCGKDEPSVLELFTGISMMWADDYAPHLEGQSINVTGLKRGRYVLVHRVNPTRKLHESDRSNNNASVLLRLSWPRGMNRMPKVKLLKECPGTARCR